LDSRFSISAMNAACIPATCHPERSEGSKGGKARGTTIECLLGFFAALRMTGREVGSVDRAGDSFARHSAFRVPQ
jgi:hypothetical protein